MRVLDEAPALPVTKLIRLCFLYSYLCENIKRIKPAAEQCAQAAMRKIIEFIDCSLLSNRLGAKSKLVLALSRDSLSTTFSAH